MFEHVHKHLFKYILCTLLWAGIVQSVKWLAVGWVARVKFLAGTEIFSFSSCSGLFWRSTQSLVQWIRWARSAGIKQRIYVFALIIYNVMRHLICKLVFSSQYCMCQREWECFTIFAEKVQCPQSLMTQTRKMMARMMLHQWGSLKRTQMTGILNKWKINIFCLLIITAHWSLHYSGSPVTASLVTI